MNGDYWILLGAWLLFGLLHSLLATEPTKNLFRKAMGRTFKYYRLLYSLFAFFSLAAVLWWQFSIPAITLWSFPIAKYLAGLPAGIAGLWLMAACIRKYFFNLSGIGVFWGRGEGGGVLEETTGE